MRIRENKVKKIIFALPRKILGLILILMILYNVINTVYGIFNKKLELQIGETKIYVAEDKTMLPTIKPNDLILAKQCTPEDLNLEDIIIFDENGIIKVQRITKIQGLGEKSNYTTKGDNNYYNNNVIIKYEQIKGKFVKRIPSLGLVIKILESKVTTIFIVIILILLFLFNRDMKMKSIKRRKNKKIDQLRRAK
ncbi:MAG: signal peptidase I [Clostridia bacterium]|nr:signal peptidase I [Clostridiales bacterium]